MAATNKSSGFKTCTLLLGRGKSEHDVEFVALGSFKLTEDNVSSLNVREIKGILREKDGIYDHGWYHTDLFDLTDETYLSDTWLWDPKTKTFTTKELRVVAAQINRWTRKFGKLNLHAYNNRFYDKKKMWSQTTNTIITFPDRPKMIPWNWGITDANIYREKEKKQRSLPAKKIDSEDKMLQEFGQPYCEHTGIYTNTRKLLLKRQQLILCDSTYYGGKRSTFYSNKYISRNDLREFKTELSEALAFILTCNPPPTQGQIAQLYALDRYLSDPSIVGETQRPRLFGGRTTPLAEKLKTLLKQKSWFLVDLPGIPKKNPSIDPQWYSNLTNCLDEDDFKKWLKRDLGYAGIRCLLVELAPWEEGNVQLRQFLIQELKTQTPVMTMEQRALARVPVARNLGSKVGSFL